MWFHPGTKTEKRPNGDHGGQGTRIDRPERGGKQESQGGQTVGRRTEAKWGGGCHADIPIGRSKRVHWAAAKPEGKKKVDDELRQGCKGRKKGRCTKSRGGGGGTTPALKGPDLDGGRCTSRLQGQFCGWGPRRVTSQASF